MTEITVKTSRVYSVMIGSHLLGESGTITSKIIRPCTAAIVSDDRVFPLYGETVKSSYEKAGFQTVSFVFKNGEESKNLKTAGELLEFMAKNHLSRNDIIVALGGGVTGDLAGFAASIYLRGIKFVQIPTTLLAAVDSSVGGKTGVDLDAGKNLAGSFWQPSLVLCDTETFGTLSPETIADGMAEVIKYAVIFDENFFDFIMSHTVKEHYEKTVAACVHFKRDVVQRDEFDKGERQLLNFGHTIGHAIEAKSGFHISHGQAVAMGMACITRSCVEYRLCGKTVSERIEKALSRFGLPEKCPYTAEELIEAMFSDKKIKGESITLVLLERIGRAYLKELPTRELLSFVSAGL